MNTLVLIILSTFAISLMSLAGIIAFQFREKTLNKILLGLVALSAGALIGGAFLHLIPETLELLDYTKAFALVIAGFVLFFMIEKFLYWRHCHQANCKIHSFAYMSLFGDSVHNLIDGMIIAASFAVNGAVGLASTIAIIFHEVPQEIGEFGVLVYGGFERKKALLLNFLTATTAIAGGIIGFFIASYSLEFVKILLPFAAGGFIYIASADLVPEIKKGAVNLKTAIINFVIFIIGILMMYFIK